MQPSGELNPHRLKLFANFFKSYMGVMPVVAAAFAPAITLAKALPIYDEQSRSLAVFSGLLGFLLVAFVFYSRHVLARTMFPILLARREALAAAPRPRNTAIAHVMESIVTVLPLVFILFSIGCFFTYSAHVDQSVTAAQARAIRLQEPTRTVTADVSDEVLVSRTAANLIPKRADILRDTNYPIPGGESLAVFYLGIFFFAELAFVLMATREYLQDVARLSDLQIIEQWVAATQAPTLAPPPAPLSHPSPSQTP